jgi:acyl-[acyl-carrier-protein]-phospholipid O-acyltransferase/long-chain-fatty-acid--[acyl-carrier-protein] ligase
LIYRVQIIGLENYYKAGDKVLIIANHASFLDPPLLGAFLPDRLVFAIDTFHSRSLWINPFLSYLRAFPVDPTNPMAAKTLIEQLRQHKPVIIFPEGRITVTGSLMKIYEGPGLIADKAGAKLLPIRIDGPQYSPFSRLHGKVKLKLFPKIAITILEPQKIQVPNHLQGRRRRHEIGKHLYDIMSNMMFKETKDTQTLFESFIEAKKQYGDKYIILEDADHKCLSYRKIILGSFVLGKNLKKYTQASDFVGILMPNVASAAVLFFATQAYGRVPAMLNYSTGVRNIISCCVAAKIKIVITAHKFIEKAHFYNIIDALQENGIKVIFLEDVRTSITVFDKIYGLIATAYPLAFYRRLNRPHPQTVDLPAVLLFTSGSEGIPKGVVLSHANIQSNIKQAACRVDFSSHDKVFNCLPIFHSFGLTGGFLLPVLSGVRSFFYPSPLHYRIIPEIVYGSNATVLFGTDTFLNGFAKYAHPYDFYSIRYIFAGAEKLRDETKRTYMEKFGIRILEGYGATEASPIVSLNTPMHYKSGSVGRLTPNIEFYLEKVEGIDKGGRLIIAGPNIMLGYLKADNPGILQKPKYKIKNKIRKGWYDTGDIVDIDEDGFITILGRAKRFAKIAGEMISLTVIEDNIYKLYPGSILATISLPDPKKGEIIILFIDNNNAKREEIHAFFKQLGFSELFVPKIIKYQNPLPLLTTGKVDYVALKEMAIDVDLSTINENEE